MPSTRASPLSSRCKCSTVCDDSRPVPGFEMSSSPPRPGRGQGEVSISIRCSELNVGCSMFSAPPSGFRLCLTRIISLLNHPQLVCRLECQPAGLHFGFTPNVLNRCRWFVGVHHQIHTFHRLAERISDRASGFRNPSTVPDVKCSSAAADADLTAEMIVVEFSQFPDPISCKSIPESHSFRHPPTASKAWDF
jgi:hypothetical protein